MLNVIPCGMKDLGEILHLAWERRLTQRPLFIHGQPGIGKSRRIAHFCRQLQDKLHSSQELAHDKGVILIDLRLTTLEAVDLRGLQFPDKESGRSVHYPPEFLPQDDGNAYVILLDELTTAEPRLQAASYELVLDRRIGKYKLPSSVMVIAAGNDVEDGAICYEMGSALADRFMHIRLETSVEAVIEFGMEEGWHPFVVTFLKTCPNYLTEEGGVNVQAEAEHLVKPSPRSWEGASDVCKTTENRNLRSIMINGLVGEATTIHFLNTVEEIGGLPDMSTLLKMDAASIQRSVPANLSALYGLTYSMVARVEKPEEYERAVYVFHHAYSVDDDLPRAETQALAMELLLDKAFKKKVLNSLTASKTYRELYLTKNMELAS